MLSHRSVTRFHRSKSFPSFCSYPLFTLSDLDAEYELVERKAPRPGELELPPLAEVRSFLARRLPGGIPVPAEFIKTVGKFDYPDAEVSEPPRCGVLLLVCFFCLQNPFVASPFFTLVTLHS